MTDGVAQLRRQTVILHQALEDEPIFSAVIGPKAGVAEVADMLAVMQRFLAGVEPALLAALDGTVHAGLYRPRLKLLSADLAGLGRQPFFVCSGEEVIGPCARLLGMVYAIEGSALGGQVISRHLASLHGGSFPVPLRYFDVLAKDCAAHWHKVLKHLAGELRDSYTIDLAVDGATTVFSDLAMLARA